MSTTESKKPQDKLAANLNLAIACRILSNYMQVMDFARDGGADVTGMPMAASHQEISDRYERVIQEYLPERPSTAKAVAASINFAAQVLIDQTWSDVFSLGTILGQEQDRNHAVQALTNIGEWMTERENAEYLAAERGQGGGR